MCVSPYLSASALTMSHKRDQSQHARQTDIVCVCVCSCRGGGKKLKKKIVRTMLGSALLGVEEVNTQPKPL